jgi:hypothetical protein
MRENPVISYGNQRCHNEKGQYHRTDGPAIFYVDGSQEWYINGKRHRVDGPAYTGINGYQEWWINNKLYFDNKSFQQATNLSDEDMLAMILKYGNVE